MRAGSIEEKISLIGLLVFRPNKENVSFIRKAAEDDNDSVRVLANTALQKMEDLHINRIKNIEKDPDKLPKEKYYELIVAYDEYIFSGLIIEELKPKYINKVFTLFEEADIHNTDDIRLIKTYIRYCVRNDRLNKAERTINEYFDKINNKNELYVWQLEIAYKKGKYEEMKKILRQIDEKKLKHREKALKMYYFWKEKLNEES